MSPAEVTEKLGLHRMRDRSWFVHPSCATSGEGLFEGESWRCATCAVAGAGQCCLALVPQPRQPLTRIAGLSWLSSNVKKQTGP